MKRSAPYLGNGNTRRNRECLYNGIASYDWSTQHQSDQSATLHYADKAKAPVTLYPEAIANAVLEFKNQVEGLSCRVERRAASFTAGIKLGGYGNHSDSLRRESAPYIDHSSLLKKTPTATAKCFYGPTSPEYSLNVAQIRAQQTGSSHDHLSYRQLQLACIGIEPALTENAPSDDASEGI
ncbi:Zn(2)-C6 fungal-type DNA-binding domain protein [Fusarium sp. NRRL 25303]|nr:Zn(2)-C6 fungal-type DNA-binding domain protein [Fusarium sp. NRRL 25303]